MNNSQISLAKVFRSGELKIAPTAVGLTALGESSVGLNDAGNRRHSGIQAFRQPGIQPVKQSGFLIQEANKNRLGWKKRRKNKGTANRNVTRRGSGISTSWRYICGPSLRHHLAFLAEKRKKDADKAVYAWVASSALIDSSATAIPVCLCPPPSICLTLAPFHLSNCHTHTAKKEKKTQLDFPRGKYLLNNKNGNCQNYHFIIAFTLWQKIQESSK